MNHSITIIDFKKGDCYLAKVSKSSTKKFKLFVTHNYELAKKFETELDALKMMNFLQNRFNVEVELNS